MALIALLHYCAGRDGGNRLTVHLPTLKQLQYLVALQRHGQHLVDQRQALADFLDPDPDAGVHIAVLAHGDLIYVITDQVIGFVGGQIDSRLGRDTEDKVNNMFLMAARVGPSAIGEAGKARAGVKKAFEEKQANGAGTGVGTEGRR